MTDIHTLLRPPIDMTAVANYLDALEARQRIRVATSLSRAEQSALFDAAKGFRKVTVEHFVPTELAPVVPVHHWGINSLPLFRRFQKRFCRPDDAEAAARGELWGYNAQLFRWFTGPGYFVAYNIDDGQVLIDYTRLPPRGAPGWPRVIPNSARLSRFVYNGTKDTMRGVSAHVTIGGAARNGVPMPNWFVLCREDPKQLAAPQAPQLPAKSTGT